MKASFYTTEGRTGYLREAYRGGPYARLYLCAEAFDTGEAYIPPAILKERLPHTFALVEERARDIYDSPVTNIEEVKQSFRDFVALCEKQA